MDSFVRFLRIKIYGFGNCLDVRVRKIVGESIYKKIIVKLIGYEER